MKVSVNFQGVFWTLLQILFIALKLIGVISWSWAWVLAPTWIGFITSLIILVIAFIIIKKVNE